MHDPRDKRQNQRTAVAQGGNIGLLGVFPSFATLSGGIQVSGSIAWDGLTSGWQGSRDALVLFDYGAHQDKVLHDGQVVSAPSRPAAFVAALRRQWPVKIILVWHLSLLKLLPFFRIPEARVVVFLHGIEAWKPQYWLTRTLLHRVDLFLSNSDYTWQHFTRAHPGCAQALHQTTPLGIASWAGHVPTPGTPPVALMIGRLLRSEDYKGHREMITAWPLVLEQMPEAELWIIGAGDLRRPLEQLVIERGLAGKVRFWGWVSEAKKQELLAHCRCLALPSRSEGFGLVYLEAMRLGRPCLVSTMDAGREVVNPPEAGLAADPQRPEELAEAVCRLLSDGSVWVAWSHQASERYAAHFTARHFQDRLLAALRPLL